MTTTFKLAPHAGGRDCEVVEVFKDGVFVASIYPLDDGMRVISFNTKGPVEQCAGIWKFGFEGVEEAKATQQWDLEQMDRS